MEVVEILFATKNLHKVVEANVALKEFGVVLKPADVPKLEIQSDDLERIAVVAAKEAYRHVREPIVVEDAGLFIEALNGFPGPYSNYVFRTLGLAGILKLLEGVRDRRACFRSIVALALSEDHVETFVGEVCGYIAYEARGFRGFGFDPIFIPEGETRTFAEMSTEEKTSMSHRGKAFRKLGEWIAKNRERLIAVKRSRSA